MFNFKNLNGSGFKGGGIRFLAIFLAALVASNLMKVEKVGTPIGATAITGAGLVATIAGKKEWVKDAGLGVALMGSFKMLHSVADAADGTGSGDKVTNGLLRGLKIPANVTNLIKKHVPQMSGVGSMDIASMIENANVKLDLPASGGGSSNSWSTINAANIG